MRKLEDIYSKIAKPISVLFFLLGLITFVDFIIPRSHAVYTISDKEIDIARHVRYDSPHYSIKLNGEWIKTNQDTFEALYEGDSIFVGKTRILKKITSVEDPNKNLKTLDIYVAPYTYFPLYPVLFILPLIFNYFKQDSIFLMTTRPLSIGIAFISLLMILF